MKCSVCNAPAKEALVYGVKKKKILFWEIETGSDARPFCRQHLLNEYKEKFERFTDTMLLFHSGAYYDKECAGTLSSTLEYFLKKTRTEDEKEYGQLLKTWLDAVKGNCQLCAEPVHVGYLEGYGVAESFLKGKVIQANPQRLCCACAYKKIEYSLQNFTGNLGNHLSIPNKNNSILYIVL